jgi:hypothetical protein
MAMIRMMFTAALLAGTLSACGAHPAAPSAATRVASTSGVRFLDRIEAHVANETGTDFAFLSFTAKSLMSSFTDDDVTVFTPVRGDEPQQNLFCSKVFLGQDGRLYLLEKPNSGRARYYQIGDYEQGRAAGDPVRFTLAPGMKLEARRQSMASGPFVALVVVDKPAPTTPNPHYVRGN